MSSKTLTNKGSKKAHRISNPFAKRLYTLKEAGHYLGRSEYSVRTLIWNGVLPVVRHGKKQWVDVTDMDAFISQNKERIQ